MTQEILIRERGISPGMPGLSPSLSRELSGLKNCTVRLEPETYLFTAETAVKADYACSNTDFANPRNIGIHLENVEDLTIDGCGATLLCSGQMMGLAAARCQNLTLKNLTLDWDLPLNAEGLVVNGTADYADVRLDAPYVLRGDRLFLKGPGWEELFDGVLVLVDAQGHLVRGTGDSTFYHRVEEPEKGILRLFGRFDPVPQPGCLAVLRSGDRRHPGFFFHDCKNVALENVTIRYAAGLGILTQFCENLTFSRVTFSADGVSRRFTCGHDDGIQLSNDSGLVRVENCWFHGLYDDPINLHGSAVQVTEVLDSRTLRCRFIHQRLAGLHPWAKPGHELSLITSATMAEYGRAQVEECRPEGPTDFILTFSKPLPEGIKPGHALENLTNTPALICKDSYFGSCRARSILVSTPKPVVIEDCVFESAGAAILMAGDTHLWYETGGCKDVLIRHNHFLASCCTCRYMYSVGVISLCPDIPEPDPEKPLHRNIRIVENTFHPNGMPVLDAFSAGELTFAGNRLFPEPGRPAGRPIVRFRSCGKLFFHGNRWIGQPHGDSAINGAQDGPDGAWIL